MFSAANDLLESAIDTADIEELKHDKELRDWTETGYHLHKGRNLTTCKFCQKSLDAGFLDRLGSFFTEELRKVKTQIGERVTELEKCRHNLGGSDLDSGKLFPNLTTQYLKAKSEIEESSNRIDLAIRNLAERLKEKNDYLHDRPKHFEKIQYPGEAIINFNDQVTNILGIMERHNNRVAKAADEIGKAAEGIELHTIASMLINREYFEKKKKQMTWMRKLNP